MEANPSPVETEAQTTVPLYPKDVYDDAHIENEHRDFNAKLMEVRGANTKPEAPPPPVPAAIKALTELEMLAGQARVKHFEEIEADRKKIAARVPEKWEGKSTPIFRPGDAEEYKTTLKSPAQTISKDRLAQPRR